MNREETAWRRRRVEDWLAAPVLGHGLWARYQDARYLLSELLDELEAQDRLIEQLGDVFGEVVPSYAQPGYGLVPLDAVADALAALSKDRQ